MGLSFQTVCDRGRAFSLSATESARMTFANRSEMMERTSQDKELVCNEISGTISNSLVRWEVISVSAEKVWP